MNLLKDMSIGKRLAVTQLVVILITFTALIVFMTSSMYRLMNTRVVNELNTELGLCMDMIDAYNDVLEDKADVLHRIFTLRFPDRFSLDTENFLLRNGGTVLNLNYEQVDAFARQTGGVATIFARKGSDFIRITTSLKKEDGSRANGTALDRAHPAYSLCLRGESYTGKAKLFGRDYMTKYVPVRDGAGDIIGILFIGTDFTDGLKALKNKIKSIKIGDTGYVFAVNAAAGNTRGEYAIHPAKEGRNESALESLKGRNYLQEMLDKKDGVITYYEFAGGDGKADADEHIAVYTYYKNWDWIIAGGSKLSELTKDVGAMRNSIILISLLAASVIAVMLFILTVKWVARPLQKIIAVAKDLAEGEGDLTKRLAADSHDELGELAGWFNRFIGDLQGILANIKQDIAQITERTQHLVSNSREMAEGAQEQTSRTSQVATSMDEINATVGNVAKDSSAANTKAKEAGEISQRSSAVVQQTVDGMNKIDNSVKRMQKTVRELSVNSEQIGDIINVIDDVAEQTNLLALNAAIEAARAGEQGRGFAVVADEVRKLAERTTVSTKEIAARILKMQTDTKEAVVSMEASSTEVTGGVKLAHQAGLALGEILQSAQEVQGLIQQIATAAEEQSATTGKITESVEMIDQISKKTSGAAQQTAAVSQEISRLIEELEKMVARFKLE